MAQIKQKIISNGRSGILNRSNGCSVPALGQGLKVKMKVVQENGVRPRYRGIHPIRVMTFADDIGIESSGIDQGRSSSSDSILGSDTGIFSIGRSSSRKGKRKLDNDGGGGGPHHGKHAKFNSQDV